MNILKEAKKKSKKDKIYLAGSFYGWRDEFIDRLADFEFEDPRAHRQHAIAKLVEDDMSSTQRSDILLAYFPKGKSRGTMTYAEIGAIRAKGNCIITIDEDAQDPLFAKVASYSFNNKEQAFELLKSGKYGSKFAPIQPKLEEICKKILFLGDLSNIQPVIQKISKTKKCLQKYNASDLENFASDVDVTVINFNKAERDREAIFYMGVSYVLDIPIILCTSNPIVYPPLAGLSRRIFTGRKRGEILEDYLNVLHEQNISSEAQIMYKLFEKYNS